MQNWEEISCIHQQSLLIGPQNGWSKLSPASHGFPSCQLCQQERWRTEMGALPPFHQLWPAVEISSLSKILTVKIHSDTLLWKNPPAPHRWTQKLPEGSPPGFPAQDLWGRSVCSKAGDRRGKAVNWWWQKTSAVGIAPRDPGRELNSEENNQTVPWTQQKSDCENWKLHHETSSPIWTAQTKKKKKKMLKPSRKYTFS